MSRIKLGMFVKDEISGFQGYVVARTEWLYGCVRVGIAHPKCEPGKLPPDYHWFDEGQVKQVKGKTTLRGTLSPQTRLSEPSTPGGPSRPIAPSRDPKR